MLDETPMNWQKAINIAEGVYPDALDRTRRCAVARREGFEDGKRAVIAALLAAQAREWDRQLVKLAS